MTLMPDIITATTGDRERALKMLVLGFAADPVARWIWPEPERYLMLMPRFAEAFGGRAFENETAYIAGGGHAIALWLPPDGDAPALDEPSESDREHLRSQLRLVAVAEKEVVIEFASTVEARNPNKRRNPEIDETRTGIDGAQITRKPDVTCITIKTRFVRRGGARHVESWTPDDWVTEVRRPDRRLINTLIRATKSECSSKTVKSKRLMRLDRKRASIETMRAICCAYRCWRQVSNAPSSKDDSQLA